MTTETFKRSGLTIHLIHEIDNLKSSWGIWECEVEDKDGNIKSGSIQSDGHMFSFETLEYYEE